MLPSIPGAVKMSEAALASDEAAEKKRKLSMGAPRMLAQLWECEGKST